MADTSSIYLPRKTGGRRSVRRGQAGPHLPHRPQGSEFTAGRLRHACQRLGGQQPWAGQMPDSAVIESWHSRADAGQHLDRMVAVVAIKQAGDDGVQQHDLAAKLADQPPQRGDLALGRPRQREPVLPRQEPENAGCARARISVAPLPGVTDDGTQ